MFGNPLRAGMAPSGIQAQPMAYPFMPSEQGQAQAPAQPTFWDRIETVMRQANQADADPWGAAYAARFNPQQAELMGVPYVGKEDDPMRDIEHFLYARDTARLGPMGFAQMVYGTPAHAGLKALGLKSGDWSAEEVLRGWQGAGIGMREWLEDLYNGD